MQQMQQLQQEQQQKAENNINNNQKTTRKYQLTNNYTDHLARARGIAIGVVFFGRKGAKRKGLWVKCYSLQAQYYINVYAYVHRSIMYMFCT